MTAPASYFPAGLFHDIPALDEFKRSWYGSVLAHLEEAPLAPGTLRFLWIPSFAPTRVCRVQLGGVLHARILGRPGTTRALDEEERRWVARASLRLAGLATREERRGHDGEVWLYEHALGEVHHVVDRWEPEEGPMRELGRVLERLAGWDVSR